MQDYGFLTLWTFFCDVRPTFSVAEGGGGMGGSWGAIEPPFCQDAKLFNYHENTRI